MEDRLVEQLRTMMKFLGKARVVVPHLGLPLPDRAVGNWRSQQIFFYWASDGTLSYKGWGGPNYDITVDKMKAPEPWVKAAHSIATYDVREKVRRLVRDTTMPYAGDMIYRANGLKWMV